MVEEDGLVKIPDELIKELGWTENTFLICMMDGANIILKEKTDWTVDDFQENMEIIIERINETGKPHHLLYDGKVFVIAPYNDQIKNLMAEIKNIKNDII